MSEELGIVPAEKSEEFSDLMIDWMALSDGLHDSWADWMPFLVFGVPYVQIAKIFNVDKSAITNALKLNHDFGRRVAQGRKMVKRQLHYLWLDQKAVSAWKNIDFYLSCDPFEKKEDGTFLHDAGTRRMMFSEKAKMTRFVLQQLGLQVQRHEVLHHSPPPMFMGDATLADHVIDRVRDIMNGEEERNIEIIATQYRVLNDDESESSDFKVDASEEKLEAPYDRRSRVHGYSD